MESIDWRPNRAILIDEWNTIDIIQPINYLQINGNPKINFGYRVFSVSFACSPIALFVQQRLGPPPRGHANDLSEAEWTKLFIVNNPSDLKWLGTLQQVILLSTFAFLYFRIWTVLAVLLSLEPNSSKIIIVLTAIHVNNIRIHENTKATSIECIPLSRGNSIDDWSGDEGLGAKASELRRTEDLRDLPLGERQFSTSWDFFSMVNLSPFTETTLLSLYRINFFGSDLGITGLCSFLSSSTST